MLYIRATVVSRCLSVMNSVLLSVGPTWSSVSQSVRQSVRRTVHPSMEWLRDVNKCWLNVCCVCTVWTLAHGTVHESNCLLHSTDLSIISRHLIYCQIYTELQRQLWGAAGFTYPKGWRTPKFSRLDARYQRSCLFPHWKIRTIAPPLKIVYNCPAQFQNECM